MRIEAMSPVAEVSARGSDRIRAGAFACAFVLLVGMSGCASWMGSADGTDAPRDFEIDAGASSGAVELDPSARERVELMTREARDRFTEATDFLAAQPALRVVVEASFDVHQSDGRLLEFGSRREMTIRRPDRVRVDVARRDGETRSIRFDGQTFVIDFPEQAAYVRIPLAGTYYEAFDFLEQKLDAPIPLSHLFSENLGPEIGDEIESGYIVGPAMVDGRDCDHIAFRLADVDVQVWVAADEQPLIARLVITYKKTKGNPQFRATFRDWNFTLAPSDDLFGFEPPEGSRELEFETITDSTSGDGEEPQG